ncbi:beta-1,4-galactosyltransferase 4 [Sphaerodactylus townsendi]|uniref:beta-1,4-galactosyltransferase 4 n=1 Tax=Sphaerodactylus townsendi TaxID=933632 RepID=UPI00202668AF|nr:beta-1,4-galactosyltransferase 4 [Sphaerodactylus townsendi]XP_048348622.1 beta-1,4-galactosyltransferase 4 [Sphaerodactylus townsendi]XP_048348623.1 beta-1,4-galactosyltransferase 4 [Sphaerodactylus townsendi]XP_048348624.1 beta-1,4-galactosyltransferase 4 [Sphaerodactylus townsendi]
MGLSYACLHVSYKLKLLMLFTACILLVGWATSSYLVDAVHETPQAKSAVASFRKSTTSAEEQKEDLGRQARATVKLPTVKLPTTKSLCPPLSPYLRGPSKLTFRASLTLEEVQKENPQVSKGRHHPEDCLAQQRVAILIPHRNRERHLLYLLEHLHPFLQRQQLDYGIFVIHQAGEAKFNRAKLLNVGYLEALKEENWDCFIFHDVDLVPENDYNIYMCGSQPTHLVVGRNSTGYRLRYQGYFGGVTALTREQFSKVNGFSNNYWGWGGEDDDLRLRVEMQRWKVIRPSPNVAKYTMIFHTRDRGNEANGQRMNLLRQVSRVWKTDGLNSCTYKLLSVEYNPLYTNITVDFGMPIKTS